MMDGAIAYVTENELLIDYAEIERAAQRISLSGTLTAAKWRLPNPPGKAHAGGGGWRG